MNRRNPCVLALALMVACAASAAEAPWAAPEADARVSLRVEGDLYARERADQEIVIDFNELLGAHRVLAAQALELRDVATGETVKPELAQDRAVRYASANPILRLRWSSGALKPFERREWRLYLRTTSVGDAAAWKPITRSFSPAEGNVVLSTSFEEPDPKRRDRPRVFIPWGRDKGGEKSRRVWSDEGARTGKRCLKISRVITGKREPNSNRPFWWTWPPVPVKPGRTYRLSTWLRKTAGGPRSGGGVTLVYRDAKKRRIRGKRTRLQIGGSPGDWALKTATALAPPDARYVEMLFSLYNDGTVYCDDLTLGVVGGSALPALPVTLGRLEERSDLGDREQTAPGAEERKVLKCGVAERPPKLDGVLDDPCWKTAGRASDFVTFWRVPGTDVKTTVLACADRRALYFGFVCTEPSTKNLLAKADKRDGRLWLDDSVELFLDTNLDRRTYYQIIVNSKGVFFDQDTGAPGLAGAKWNGPIRAAAKVWPDRWTAEVRLDFAGLRLAEAEGRVWGANFARSSMRGGRSLYSWIKPKRNFGEAARFGKLTLPFDASANAVTGRPLAGESLFWGRGALPFEVRNNRARPVRVRLDVTEERGKARTPVGRAEGAIPARSRRELRVTCAFARQGEAKLRYDLSEVPAGRLLYTTALDHTVPPPLDVSLDNAVLYLGESRLTGQWALGLHEESLEGLTLRLTVLRASRPGVVSEERISPRRRAGRFAVALGPAPAGAYRLRAELLRGGRSLAKGTRLFQRIRGPFD